MKQRVAVTAVQPVLLTVQRLIHQSAHARRKRTDGQVQTVVLHAQLQLVGAGHRQVQMHRRVFLAVGPDRFGQRQSAVADGRVDHPQVQRTA
ncbi:hypothetical protein D3C78_1262430 [compost metagenome]